MSQNDSPEPNDTEASRSMRCSTAQRWQSNAEWEPIHGFPSNVTADTHQSEGHAQAVCDGLKREGLGGERIHFPVRTWVSECQ